MGSESFQVGEHLGVLGDWCAQRAQRLHVPSHNLALRIFSSGCSPVPFIRTCVINGQAISICFPGFCEPFQQNTEPKEQVTGTLVYSQLVRSTGNNLEHLIGIWSGGSSCGTEPWTWGYDELQGDRVRTELNCQTPSWCENCLMWKTCTCEVRNIITWQYSMYE